MKIDHENAFPFFSAILLAGVSIAQTEVDVSTLEFERTDNRSAVYSQYAANTKLAAPTSPNSRIILDLGAGHAELVQSQDNRLKAKAEIVISVRNKKKIVQELQDLELFIEQNGDELKLVSIFDYDDSEKNIKNTGFLSSPERKVNMKIYVPKNLTVKMKDRAGDVEINGITNDLTLSDGSGNIRVDGLYGNFSLRDNSGDISIFNLNNKVGSQDNVVKIWDASGSVFLRDTGGETRIDDNSGDVEVTNHAGSLAIFDSSGSISAKNIEGDSRVVDTSGEITLVAVDGNVTISDTSGDIYVDTVTEDVILKRDGAGSFVTRNVDGRVHKGR